MQQPSESDHPDQSHGDGDQQIGAVNADAGNADVSTPEYVRSTIYRGNRVGDNAQAHFGDQHNQYHEVIISKSQGKPIKEAAEVDQHE